MCILFTARQRRAGDAYHNIEVSIKALRVPICVHTIDGRQHITNPAIFKRELINKRMREAILKEIKMICPAYHAGILPKDIKKPFAVLNAGREGKTFSSKYIMWQIEVFAPISAPYVLDETVRKIKKALNKRSLQRKMSEGRFILEYASSTGDFLESEHQAIGRMLEFKTFLPLA